MRADVDIVCAVKTKDSRLLEIKQIDNIVITNILHPPPL